MRCQLCGAEFEPVATGCKGSCPMSGHCHMICCPHCGYQVVDESKSKSVKFVDRVLAMFRHKVHAANGGAGATRLSDVPVGATATLRSLAALEPKRQARLIAFGLTPGSKVEVVQRSPAPVTRAGETELALGRDILDHILVTV